MNTSEDGFNRLARSRVAIVGLGLMGGSLALALKGHCAQVLGIDSDPHTLELARQNGVADRLSADPAELLPQAEIILLATPVYTILSLLQELPHLHPGYAVVIDVGSTKSEIVSAMNQLPQRFNAVGGHPMCGKERGSLCEAESTLYHHAPFALVATRSSTPAIQELAQALVQSIGANPLWLEADCHDRWVAATSHLPYLLANALSSATPLEAAPLVGPGFRSTSRVGATPPQMMLDILSSNRNNVLSAIRQFRRELDQLESQLASGDLPSLSSHLAQGASQRAALLHPSGGPS